MNGKWFCLMLALATNPIGWAQGTVSFANSAPFQTNADRFVYHVDGVTPLLGTNWFAQLYYGRDANSLNPVTAQAVRFHDGTMRLPGTWIPATRTLDGLNTGEIAVLQVRVWDGTLFSSFDNAVAGGGLYGSSMPFTYAVPDPGAPAQHFYMENLRSFTLIPEPTTIALFALGGVLVFAQLRRRK